MSVNHHVDRARLCPHQRDAGIELGDLEELLLMSGFGDAGTQGLVLSTRFVVRRAPRVTTRQSGLSLISRPGGQCALMVVLASASLRDGQEPEQTKSAGKRLILKMHIHPSMDDGRADSVIRSQRRPLPRSGTRRPRRNQKIECFQRVCGEVYCF